MNTNYLLYYIKEKTIKDTKFDDVIDIIYELEAKVPTIEQIKEYIRKGSNNKIKTYLKNVDPLEIIDKIKKSISKIDNKIPLYDVYKRNLFIISKDLIYKRVIYQSYRFPDNTLIELLKKKKKELQTQIKKLKNKPKSEKKIGKIELQEVHYGSIQEKISLQTEYHKLELMLDFLKSFDIDVLETTYMKIMYSYEIGKNITVCDRPSFKPYYTHIKPYYTRSELINLALNMEIIKPNNKYYDKEAVMKLCENVKINDISADTIMKHQEHIINHNKIGVIQYYSLQGSYFTNQYLRNLVNYEYKNELLEKVIKSIWELINDAPEFDKEYTLYRFIHDDSYLKHLNIGDTFIEPGFVSTTRDPFYRAETYKFGFILIKINIPAKIKGVGLCLESYSHFPEEQEIILAPSSILRLDKKDENALYYHTDDMYASKITTRYEFKYIGKEKINFVDRPILKDETKLIDFIGLRIPDVFTVQERIKQFINDNVNDIYQFKTKIGDNEVVLMIEWYDSTNAYKKYYAATTNNGFAIYTIIDNYISFIIELGEDNNETYMYVNYYFKWASSNKNKNIKDKDFIEFLSKVAYYFGIKNIILYTEYSSCDIEFNQQNKKGGNYCIDFYKYLKFKERKFQNKNVTIDSTELKSQFSYYELERLRTTEPSKILDKEDRDELYQIYNKVYKLYFGQDKDNLADFYIWIVENDCIYLESLIKKMYRLYPKNNPFDNDYYVLDAPRHLYNNNIISEPLIFKKSKDIKELITDRIPKNEYRLQYYKKSRVP